MKNYDGSYKVENKQLVKKIIKKGYQVSFFNGVLEKDLKLFEKTRNEMKAQFEEFIGIYNNKIELSYIVQNKRKAINLAKKFNQISIWDNINNCEILTK